MSPPSLPCWKGGDLHRFGVSAHGGCLDCGEGRKREPAPNCRVYIGKRYQADGAAVVVRHDPPKQAEMLNPRYDLRNHSPDGFQWGYGGSGPAQLALALCADATGDDGLAQRIYQQFKAEIIQPLQGNDWSMAAMSVREFAASLDAVDEIQGRAPRPPQGHSTRKGGVS